MSAEVQIFNGMAIGLRQWAVQRRPQKIIEESGDYFLPFKGEWVEASGLVGGFARLGGKPVLVMGPRSHVGIRSFASVVRARELLQIANKTRSPKILVIGTKWYRGLGDEDEMAIRARADFVRLLFAPGTPRVSIIYRVPQRRN